MLQSRHQQFAARLANTYRNKLMKLHQDPSSGTSECRAVKKVLEHVRTTKDMNWPAPGDGSVVRTVILDDATTAKRAAHPWATEKVAKVGARVGMWWTNRWRSDDGRVGAAEVCKHRDELMSWRSYLGTGRMEVFDAELWAIRLAFGMAIEKRETLEKQGVETVAVFSDAGPQFDERHTWWRVLGSDW
jgi:hypothetical protein